MATKLRHVLSAKFEYATLPIPRPKFDSRFPPDIRDPALDQGGADEHISEAKVCCPLSGRISTSLLVAQPMLAVQINCKMMKSLADIPLQSNL